MTCFQKTKAWCESWLVLPWSKCDIMRSRLQLAVTCNTFLCSQLLPRAWELLTWDETPLQQLSQGPVHIYYTAALSLKSIALLRHGQNPRAHSFEEEGQIHAQNSECLTSACRKHDWIDCETEHRSGTVDVSCQLPKHRCDLCGSPNASDLLLFGSSQCQAGPPVNRRPWSDGFYIGW